MSTSSGVVTGVLEAAVTDSAIVGLKRVGNIEASYMLPKPSLHPLHSTPCTPMWKTPPLPQYPNTHSSPYPPSISTSTSKLPRPKHHPNQSPPIHKVASASFLFSPPLHRLPPSPIQTGQIQHEWRRSQESSLTRSPSRHRRHRHHNPHSVQCRKGCGIGR